MEKLLILLFLAFSLCSAQAAKKTETIYDTVVVNKTVIDTVHRLNYDSLTATLLKDSQNFYSSSFSNILWLVGIIIAVGCAIFGAAGTWNWWKARKFNEETKNELDILKKELQSQIDKQGKSFKSFKEEFRKMKAEFDVELGEVYKEFANSYFNFSMQYFYDEDKRMDHFYKLSQYFSILMFSGINLSKYDWGDFKYMKDFAEEYSKDDLEHAITFLDSLNEFMGYCKETNESKGLTEARNLWKILCEKFGGKEVVLKAIDDFRKENKG